MIPEPDIYPCDHDTKIETREATNGIYWKEVCKKCGKTISTWFVPYSKEL